VATKNTTDVKIPAPDFKYLTYKIRGTSFYISNKFQNRDGFIESYTKPKEKGKKRGGEVRDFDDLWPRAVHWSTEGWAGIPATCFRAAMISACRLVGFKMTLAKLSVFIESDGYDAEDGTPLIKVQKGEFRKLVSVTRNADGSPNVLARGQLDPGWEASITVRIDAGQFSVTDVTNLLMRVGMQVGIGAGRADSKTSCGIGAGFFEVLADENA